LLRIPEAQ
jgi:hypothetical protein